MQCRGRSQRRSGTRRSRHHPHADVVAGITAALRVGAVSPDVRRGPVKAPSVAVETSKHAQQQANPVAAGDQVMVSLNQRRLTEITDQLPLDLRPPPPVVPYDSRLTGTRDA